MTKNSPLEKLMHFLVHNGFFFTVITMCLVHATLLTIMAFANVHALIYFNVISVIVYLFCIVLCKFGHILPVYISILLEVSAYSVVATRFIGWNSFSFCFLLAIVPIIIYFGCFLFKGSKRWIVVSALVLNFAIFLFMYFRYRYDGPLYDIPDTIRAVHVIFASFVMVFSMIFYNSIYIYSSELEMVTLEKKNDQLSEDANADALTGLLNRRGFLPVIRNVMKNKEYCHFCVAFLDIDNFKRINDSYGHDCGDEVLRHISRLVKKEMTGCEICRWGGEEMIIFMKDYDFEVAKQKMEYIRKSVENTPTAFYNKRIPATITIGLEEYSDKYTDAEEIIKVADGRMYYGKQHGKNIVIFEDHAD